MKIKIMVLENDDEEIGIKFEIPDLTKFTATAIYFKLFELCLE